MTFAVWVVVLILAALWLGTWVLQIAIMLIDLVLAAAVWMIAMVAGLTWLIAQRSGLLKTRQAG